MRQMALVTAAGLSSRMHQFKPMMCLGESTMIDRVLDAFRAAGIEDILLVAGYKAELLQKHLAGQNIKICHNVRYAETKMLDSIRMGIEEILRGEPLPDYVFITPCDVPLVRPETIRAMAAVCEPVVRPVKDGRDGHPVRLSMAVIEELLRYHGPGGLRTFLEGKEADTCYVPVDDEGILFDADTPEEYKRLRGIFMKQRSDGKLWLEMDIKVNKADTVLDAQTVQFLEMIDHTGSIGLASGSMHMSYRTGWNLLNRIEADLGFPLTERCAGGENGGGTTLTERGRRLVNAYRRFLNRLQGQAEEIFAQTFREELQDERR